MFFQWRETANGRERLALEDGAEDWSKYFDVIKSQAGERYTLLEFVRGDDSEQFLRDAATLKSWLGA